MRQQSFCFLCEQQVEVHADGRLREHSAPHPGGPEVVDIRRCAGSGLSRATVRLLAAHEALRHRRR